MSVLLLWTKEWTTAHGLYDEPERQIFSKDIQAGAEGYRGPACIVFSNGSNAEGEGEMLWPKIYG